MRHRRATLVLLVVAATACGGREDAGGSSDGTWVGTITTEGNVTTVVNESGSVWGGDVGLVETLSIGVASGGEPYLLGEVRGVGVAAGRIYVLDGQLSRIRVYDLAGMHLFDIGQEGEGPGEFSNPRAMAIDQGGRIIVQGGARVSVLDLDGELIDTWQDRGGSLPPVVTVDGTTFVSWRSFDGVQVSSGLVGVSPDGSEGQRVTPPTFDTEPWMLRANKGSSTASGPVSYAPTAVFGVFPSGAIIRGVSDAYSFEIEHADGTRTAIERVVELPLVRDVESEWLANRWKKRMFFVEPGWEWNANPIPAHKPAFDQFFGDAYGRVWVRRAIGTADVPDCVEDPFAGESLSPRSCWRDVFGFDVFEEATGRFLGGVEVPAWIPYGTWPEFVEDGFLIAVEDDLGTIMVKRYRLVLPGEQ